MSGSAFLHIQDRESGPVRVVELPWMSARIGRAAFCEVRLSAQELAGVVCRLQRRGASWYLIPLSTRDRVLLDGQPVVEPASLAWDAPFQIGDCTLVLRPARSWESVRPVPQPASSSGSPDSAARPRPEVFFSDEGRPEVPRHGWRSTVPAYEPGMPAAPLRGGPPPTSEPVNPWVARWKSAASRLQPAAVDTGPRVPPIRSFQAPEHHRGVDWKEPQLQVNVPTPADPPLWSAMPKVPARGESPAWREAEPEPLAEPSPSPSLEEAVEVVEEAATAILDDFDLAEESAPEPTFEPVEEPVIELVELLPAPPPPVIESEVIEPSEPAEEFGVTYGTVVSEPRLEDLSAWYQFYSPQSEPPPASPSSVSSPPTNAGLPNEHEHRGPLEREAVCLVVSSESAADVSVRQDVLPPAELGDQMIAQAVHVVMPPRVAAPLEFEFDLASERAYPPEDRAWRPELPPLSPEPRVEAEAPIAEPEARAGMRAPRSNIRTATFLGAGVLSDFEQRAQPDGVRARSASTWQPAGSESRRRIAEPNLPSAQEILAAAGRRTAPARRREPSRKPPTWTQAVPTVAHEPNHWSPSAWIAWPPTALLVLVLGISATLLSLMWIEDSYNSSIVAQRLLERENGRGRAKPLPEGVAPPPQSWWSSTPLHLAQWGVYLGRWLEGDDPSEEAAALLDSAVRIAPLHPTARLARAEQSGGKSEPGTPALNLGLSRDAVSLAWSARTLRLAGKKEAALRLYRQAFEIAGHVERVQSDELGFSDDPSVRRYLLPGELMAGTLARDLLADSQWTFADWSSTVPENSVAALATARLLHEQSRPEAGPLLERMATSEVPADASQREQAIRWAMKAEASALLARWKDSQQDYRRAIDLEDDLTTRRSWWFNLASIALHLDDHRQSDAAIQSAVDTAAGDDISRRAMDLQHRAEPLSRIRAGGTRAN